MIPTQFDIPSVLDLLLLALMASSLAVWARVLYRRSRHGVAILPVLAEPQPRERPFWTPGDALVMFGLQILVLATLSTFAGDLLRPSGDEVVVNEDGQPRLDLATLTVLDTAVKLAAGGLTMAWLAWSTRGALGRLGLRVTRSGLWLGLKGSFLILPPVLLVSALVSSLVAYEHPVLDMIAQPIPWETMALAFVGTAIVTPIFEEFLFRVLLQGGLEHLADPAPQEDEPWRPRSWMPIIVTSIFFASMHLGQGAAPIPLFLLSCGLGYLYRQSGNMTAPVVVHMVLNATTLAVEMSKGL